MSTVILVPDTSAFALYFELPHALWYSSLSMLPFLLNPLTKREARTELVAQIAQLGLHSFLLSFVLPSKACIILSLASTRICLRGCFADLIVPQRII